MQITNKQLMVKGIYNSLKERKRLGKKSFAVLIDPDKVNNNNLEQLIELASNCQGRLLFGWRQPGDFQLSG